MKTDVFHRIAGWRPLAAGLALASVTAVIPAEAWAICYKVSYLPNANVSPNRKDYVEPGKGTTGLWTGTPDDAGASGLPAVVNINNSNFQPDGTLLASGGASFMNLGKEPYSPDQVLFRCAPEDAGQLYEYYSTNGDDELGGENEDGSRFGLPGAYRTWIKGAVIRVTNVTTGTYFSRYWQARALTGLDTDSQGYLLVKAKNFSDVNVELFRVSNENMTSGAASGGTGMYARSQPAAYLAFKGPGVGGNLAVGVDHRNAVDGWYGYWPAAVNLYNRLAIRRSATCAVTSVTPTVSFPPMNVAQLNNGMQQQVPFDIRFDCQTSSIPGLKGFKSGTGPEQTAMGVLVPAANYQSAVNEGLVTPGTGVTYLLSDGYGTDPAVASGVGVALSHANGSTLNFLGSDFTVGGGPAAGWYPVLDGANHARGAGGLTSYSTTLMATMRKVPGKTVTPGRLRASAQVVIRVQ